MHKKNWKTSSWCLPENSTINSKNMNSKNIAGWKNETGESSLLYNLRPLDGDSSGYKKTSAQILSQWACSFITSNLFFATNIINAKYSSRGFKNGLQKSVGDVTVTMSIFLTVYEFNKLIQIQISFWIKGLSPLVWRELTVMNSHCSFVHKLAFFGLSIIHLVFW